MIPYLPHILRLGILAFIQRQYPAGTGIVGNNWYDPYNEKMFLHERFNGKYSW